MYIWHIDSGIKHSLWHEFGSRWTPQHPELAAWLYPFPVPTSWKKGEAEMRREGEGEEGKRGGVAPLLKSRDPHVPAGAKYMAIFTNSSGDPWGVLRGCAVING